MKKELVKTAKQQFEERLDQLGLMSDWESQSKCGQIGKVLENGNIVIFVHENNEDKFSEYFYPPFSELRKDDKFFRECLDDFTCHKDKEFVYNMVCWLVYGKSECPLYPLDVYYPANHLLLNESHDFEDLYKEVEEPKVFTAREKWDAASVMAKELWSNDAETVKVEQTESFVKFYRADDILSCYEYPSLEEMRKDDTFPIRIMEVLLESCQTEHLGKFFNWVRCGGSFPLPIEIIFHSEYQGYKFTEYEDDCKESSRHDFKKEIDALRKKMVEHVIQLCEQGMTLNVGSFLQNVYSITWVSGSYYACANIKDVYFRKNDEGKWEFSYESKSDAQGDSSDCFLDELTIETLQDIIASMQ